MDTTINPGMPKFPQASSGTSSTSAQGAGAAAGKEQPAAVSGTGDHLKLTDSARALQEATRASENSPIDTKRVEQVRQALAGGTYQINPANIADRMLALDAQLAGPSAVDKP